MIPWILWTLEIRLILWISLSSKDLMLFSWILLILQVSSDSLDSYRFSGFSGFLWMLWKFLDSVIPWTTFDSADSMGLWMLCIIGIRWILWISLDAGDFPGFSWVLSIL